MCIAVVGGMARLQPHYQEEAERFGVKLKLFNTLQAGMAGARIVVIDDSKLVLAVVSEILESAGYEVFATDLGIEANRYIYAARPPDLILIDVMMPLLSGDRKVRLLKEREASRNIPVVLMSTKPRELAEIARAAGADGFIQKPFTDQSLLRQLRLFLTADRGAA